MNGPIDNEAPKPLRDEQLAGVSGGIGRSAPCRGIGGMFGAPGQGSVRPCPKCRRSVAPVGGKCPVCGAVMTGSPAVSV